MAIQIPSPRERAQTFIASVKGKFAITNPQFVDMLAAAFEDASKDGLRRAGHKGGSTAKERHGAEHYQRIGKKGGAIGGPIGGARVKAAFAALKAQEAALLAAK